jgi:hypothetical protein
MTIQTNSEVDLLIQVYKLILSWPDPEQTTSPDALAGQGEAVEADASEEDIQDDCKPKLPASTSN